MEIIEANMKWNRLFISRFVNEHISDNIIFFSNFWDEIDQWTMKMHCNFQNYLPVQKDNLLKLHWKNNSFGASACELMADETISTDH